MIALLTALIVAAVAVSDYFAYRWVSQRIRRKGARVALACTIIVADALPYIPMAIYALLLSDNSTLTMLASMWLLTLYVILTLPRFVFYIFWLPFKASRTAGIAGATAAAIALGVLLNGLLHTRCDVEVRHVALQFDNLPAEFDGYRIALLSDLHVGTMLSPEKECNALSNAIASEQPDAVAFVGDLINIRHSELTPSILASLRQIKARDGVYAVLGNHDRGVYIKNKAQLSIEENTRLVEHAIRHDIGWHLLRDSVAYLRRGNTSVALVGIDLSDSLLAYKHSFKTPSNIDTDAIFSTIPDSTFRITLSHLPQVWHLLRDSSHSDLTLAGHVHASQVKIQYGGLRLSPSMILHREWSGLYEEQGSQLYVNDGIGVVGFFIRVGARPEITLLELRK